MHAVAYVGNVIASAALDAPLSRGPAPGANTTEVGSESGPSE